MRCAPWTSNGPNHLGLCALQASGAKLQADLTARLHAAAEAADVAGVESVAAEMAAKRFR